MDSPVRDQVMVMFLCRPFVHILLRIEGFARYLRLIQSGDHLFRIDTGFQSEINSCILAGIQQVVTLVLCVPDTERIMDILSCRVNL